MKIREATSADIPGIQRVRHAVKENQLSDPALVPDSDVDDYINRRGKGWVAYSGDAIIGFAIADLVDSNVWALFIDPEFESKGTGSRLHKIMLDWYFDQTDRTLWLSTEPKSRAETFYRMQGWRETGIHGKGEIRFEMSRGEWIVKREK